MTVPPQDAFDIDEALTRLERTLQRARVGAVSFDAVDSSPESTLLQALATPAASVSFALGTSDERARDESEAREAGVLLDDLIARARSAIHVQTARDDRVLAVTIITLGGDTQTSVAAEASANDLLRHRQTVASELRGRAARLHLLSAVLRAATRIAIASGTGNPLLVLRVAWRFVSDVMAEHARALPST